MITKNQFNTALTNLSKTSERFTTLAAFAIEQASQPRPNWDYFGLILANLTTSNGQPSAEAKRFCAYVSAHWQGVTFKTLDAPVRTSRGTLTPIIARPNKRAKGEQVTHLVGQSKPIAEVGAILTNWGDWQKEAKPKNENPTTTPAAMLKRIEALASATIKIERAEELQPLLLAIQELQKQVLECVTLANLEEVDADRVEQLATVKTKVAAHKAA